MWAILGTVGTDANFYHSADRVEKPVSTIVETDFERTINLNNLQHQC